MTDIAQRMISMFFGIGNILGKGENGDYQQFILFQKYFKMASPLGSLKFEIV